MRIGRALAALAAGAAAAAGGPARADGLDRLADAVARLRGVGYPDVASYRVTLLLPEDEDEETVPLQELWRAPAKLALRPAEPGTSRAVVRGLAIYLEPLFVARASFLASDLAGAADALRERCGIAEDEGGAAIRVTFPAAADEAIPEELRDLAWLEAALDEAGRVRRLALATREGDEVELRCEYPGGSRAPQPRAVHWALPNDEHVEIATEYEADGDRVLPSRRTVTFPSRYDPGSTEQIVVAYRDWRLNAPVSDEDLRASDAFRYDANGLVPE
jgi:hypothetical protein